MQPTNQHRGEEVKRFSSAPRVGKGEELSDGGDVAAGVGEGEIEAARAVEAGERRGVVPAGLCVVRCEL